MLQAANFAIGDQFSCVYNGKVRPLCEVMEVQPNYGLVKVQTADGIRSFKFDLIQEMHTIALAE